VIGLTAVAAAVAAAAVGACDPGPHHDEPVGNGAPVNLVCINDKCPADTFGATETLPCNWRLELAFDRLLLPLSVTRQTFPLRDLQGNFVTPNVAYDPVARVVTISTPVDDAGSCWLAAGQTYRISIASPSDAGDVNGLRAIDGTPYVPPPAAATGYEFQVGQAMNAAPPPPPPIDFCKDVLPIFQARCAGSTCHGPPTAPGPYTTAAGLALTTNDGVAHTAIGRVAQGSNTGPRAGQAEPPLLQFNVDVPIVDPGSSAAGGGNPGHSWMMYKLLLAQPPAPDAGAAETCPGTDVTGAHYLPLTQLQSTWADEHAALSDLVIGREMPFPTNPTAPLDDPTRVALTLDELERVSRWISQPYQVSQVPSSCNGCGM
jgi:hypothetical protein